MTPNEWAQGKKKKESKIVKNGGEMRQIQKEGKRAPFCGFGALSSCKNEEEDDLGHFKTLEPHSKWIQSTNSMRSTDSYDGWNRRKKEKKI